MDTVTEYSFSQMQGGENGGDIPNDSAYTDCGIAHSLI